MSYDCYFILSLALLQLTSIKTGSYVKYGHSKIVTLFHLEIILLPTSCSLVFHWQPNIVLTDICQLPYYHLFTNLVWVSQFSFSISQITLFVIQSPCFLELITIFRQTQFPLYFRTKGQYRMLNSPFATFLLEMGVLLEARGLNILFLELMRSKYQVSSLVVCGQEMRFIHPIYLIPSPLGELARQLHF